MVTNTLSRRIILPLLAVTSLLAVSPLLAEELSRPAPATETLAAGVVAPANSCPAPMDLTLNATSPPYVFSGDFTAAQLTDVVGLNYSGPDKHFLYTFQWKPKHRCCQITKAVLTVKMQANLGGQSATSSDAGNDGIAVMHLKAVVPPHSESVYTPPFPFNAGRQVTKTWTLAPAALVNINTDNRLSIYVQDDTMVKSATLSLVGCCLSN